MTLSSRALARFGLAIRTGAVVLYIMWIVVGSCMLHRQQIDPKNLGYIATRDLPAGHRLDASDFEFDPRIPAGERSRLPAWLDPAGKYVIDRHPVNTPIAQSGLTSSPVINLGNEMVTFWFPLEKQAALANVLNADSRVDICSGICIAQNVKVLSIVCSGATPPDCYAALELSADSGTKLAPVAKDYRLILRGDSTR